MLVQWNKECIKHMSIVPIEGKAMPKKSFIRLLPGVNEISELEWEHLAPHVKDVLASGDLIKIEAKTPSGPGKPVRTAEKLSELTANKAIELVKNTVNPDSLNGWLGDAKLDKRVALAVEERIKELKIERAPIESAETDEADDENTKSKKA